MGSPKLMNCPIYFQPASVTNSLYHVIPLCPVAFATLYQALVHIHKEADYIFQCICHNIYEHYSCAYS